MYIVSLLVPFSAHNSSHRVFRIISWQKKSDVAWTYFDICLQFGNPSLNESVSCIIVSSSDPKGKVSYCQHFTFVVCILFTFGLPGILSCMKLQYIYLLGQIGTTLHRNNVFKDNLQKSLIVSWCGNKQCYHGQILVLTARNCKKKKKKKNISEVCVRYSIKILILYGFLKKKLGCHEFLFLTGRK